MLSNIKITNTSAQQTQIDIEGVIGVPEHWQFDEPAQRVATYDKFKEAISRIADLKSQTIVVNIRSTGGDVNDALLIHDTLIALPAKIVTRCYGYVASAATIIAQAATSGYREISSNALYLIHNSISSTEGNKNDLSQTMDLLSKTDQRIASIYAARSGNDPQMFSDLMNQNNGNGRWLSPTEALEAALVDKIVESAPISNDAAKIVERLGLPAIPKPKHLNPKAMNIATRWSAILESLGLNQQNTESVQDSITENDMETVQKELSHREQRLVDLQNKIVTLETQNAKLKAQATQTKPKEDPSASETTRSANDEAYNEDSRKFKS